MLNQLTAIVGAQLAGAALFAASLGGCAPTSEPTVVPCDGTGVIVSGFDTPAGCDLTPPQTLSVTVEHVAPWTPVQGDTFFALCDRAGGTVTDTDGDAWRCSNVDY